MVLLGIGMAGFFSVRRYWKTKAHRLIGIDNRKMDGTNAGA